MKEADPNEAAFFSRWDSDLYFYNGTLNDENDKSMIVYRGRNVSNPVSTGVQRAL